MGRVGRYRNPNGEWVGLSTLSWRINQGSAFKSSPQLENGGWMRWHNERGYTLERKAMCSLDPWDISEPDTTK